MRIKIVSDSLTKISGLLRGPLVPLGGLRPDRGPPRGPIGPSLKRRQKCLAVRMEWVNSGMWKGKRDAKSAPKKVFFFQTSLRLHRHQSLQWVYVLDDLFVFWRILLFSMETSGGGREACWKNLIFPKIPLPASLPSLSPGIDFANFASDKIRTSPIWVKIKLEAGISKIENNSVVMSVCNKCYKLCIYHNMISIWVSWTIRRYNVVCNYVCIM